MTNFIQRIDADLGRSIRFYIGHALDNWLIHAENVERWEYKMTASERRVVTTTFIGKAVKNIIPDKGENEDQVL